MCSLDIDVRRIGMEALRGLPERRPCFTYCVCEREGVCVCVCVCVCDKQVLQLLAHTPIQYIKTHVIHPPLLPPPFCSNQSQNQLLIHSEAIAYNMPAHTPAQPHTYHTYNHKHNHTHNTTTHIAFSSYSPPLLLQQISVILAYAGAITYNVHQTCVHNLTHTPTHPHIHPTRYPPKPKAQTSESVPSSNPCSAPPPSTTPPRL